MEVKSDMDDLNRRSEEKLRLLFEELNISVQEQEQEDDGDEEE